MKSTSFEGSDSTMDRGSNPDYSRYPREAKDFPSEKRTKRLAMEGPTIEKLVKEV